MPIFQYIGKNKGMEHFRGERGSAVTNIFDDIADGGLRHGIARGFFFDLLDGVNDGGVVSAAEFLADLDHRHLCNLAHDIHGDLARKGNICVALGGLDIFRGNAVGAADFFNDFADGDRRRLLVVYDVADGALCRADSGGWRLPQGGWR